MIYGRPTAKMAGISRASAGMMHGKGEGKGGMVPPPMRKKMKKQGTFVSQGEMGRRSGGPSQNLRARKAATKEVFA